MSRRLQIAALAALLACGFGLLLRWETARFVITGEGSSCTVSESIDCDAVQTSEYARLFGMSVSLWAAAGSLTLATLLLLVLRFGKAMLMPAGLLAAVNGAVSLVYLGIAVFALGKNCLYCNAIQALSVVAAILVVPIAWGARGAGIQGRAFAAATCAGVIALFLAGLGESYATARTNLGLLMADRGDASMRVDVADALVIGDPETATENSFLLYFDFGCPKCRQCYREAVVMQKRDPDRVHFIFKHWPLDRDCNKTMHRTTHPGSCGAAQAGQAALRIGKSRDAMRQLFQMNEFLPSKLRAMGTKWGVDSAEWQALLKSPEVMEDLATDVAEGNALEFAGVPAIFRNGRRVQDLRLLRR